MSIDIVVYLFICISRVISLYTRRWLCDSSTSELHSLVRVLRGRCNRLFCLFVSNEIMFVNDTIIVSSCVSFFLITPWTFSLGGNLILCSMHDDDIGLVFASWTMAAFDCTHCCFFSCKGHCCSCLFTNLDYVFCRSHRTRGPIGTTRLFSERIRVFSSGDLIT